MYPWFSKVLCTEHNIFMIKDLVRFRVIIFHVFITAVFTTAAVNDDTMKIIDNRY